MAVEGSSDPIQSVGRRLLFGMIPDVGKPGAPVLGKLRPIEGVFDTLPQPD
jgi:hypothetical protein